MNTHLKLLFIGSSFLYGSHASAQETVRIPHPSYQSKNTTSIEISEIALSDTATILYMDAYSHPDSWVRLASGTSLVGAATGKSYKLIRSEGFEINKKVYMPASGNVSFTLQFEAINRNDQCITFQEGVTDQDFQIKGIRLTKEDTRQKIHTRLTGEVIDRPQSSRLLLKPYTQSLRNESWIFIIEGMGVKIGKQYIDFSAPDLTGKEFKLSDCIKGKMALIDFWASWCGPCRRKSTSMIPVYEKFKDKGFTIVGVAREKKTTIDMQQAIKKDGYTWLNLVELDDKNNLWSRYGIPNAAGGTFLIDASGNILAIDPTVEEVEAQQNKLL